MAITPAPTVRESLESAVETVVPSEVVDTPAPETPAPATSAAPEAPQETEAQKAERLRNKDGTFAKGKPEPKKEEAPKAEAAPVVPPKPKAPRPSSWKKELEPKWDTMDPDVQAYINEREKQYATGVSTYKSEADRAKSVMQSLGQFEPMLQKKGIATDKWIQQMGIAHYLISEGSPQERVEAVAGIIKNNGIDITALGQLLAGQQPQYQQPQQQARMPIPQQPIDVEAAVQQALDKRQVEDAYKAFTAEVETGKYPHFADEEVKGTMAGLLQAGLAQDYPSAYDTALAMPKHKHLAATAATAATAPVPAPAADKQQQAQRARSQAVSVKSSTPSTMATAATGKGLREQLSEAFDRTTNSRV